MPPVPLKNFKRSAIPTPKPTRATVSPAITAIAGPPAFAKLIAENANKANPAAIMSVAAPIIINDFAEAIIWVALPAAALPAAFVPPAILKSFVASPATPFPAIDTSDLANEPKPGTTELTALNAKNAAAAFPTHGRIFAIVSACSVKNADTDLIVSATAFAAFLNVSSGETLLNSPVAPSASLSA